ncbi:MAG: hypothetical protein AVDCRST_MAG43-1559 [uncultured Thermomicrobiales bacterium]|uniref:MFS transporter n=1 Tax=uncultured Thermomicrobiales bacterium TaxID=1645740 RepID=A0A6J4UPV0_9BACT|nr:MAG: hypothetical protein AVDCRST_MAG43-1559 [uncultured Thermomicrobiales bacterium]
MFVPLTPGHTRRRRTNAFTPINGVLSGLLQAVADTILHPVVLLAAVAFLLNGSYYQVAGFTVITLASWTLSAVVLSTFKRLVARPYPILIGACVVRLLSVSLLAVTAFRSPHWDPGDVIRTLLVGFFLYQVSSAIIGHVSVAFLSDALRTAKRSVIFRQRAVIGSIITVISGAVVWSVNGSVADVRAALGVLFILAAISTAASTWFLFAIPAGKRQGRTGDSTSGEPGEILRPLRSRPYRRFVLFRILLGLSAAADPFIIVFGIRRVGLDLGEIGLALVALAIGHLCGWVIWPQWVVRQSPRTAFQIAALLRVFALTVSIGIPAIATSTLYTERFANPDAAIRLFLALYVLIGLSMSAHAAANQRYLMDLSATVPLHQTVLTTNAVHGILAFAPLAAAYVIGRTSLDQMLWIAAGLAFIALLASGSLVEPRFSINRRAGVRNRQRTEQRTWQRTGRRTGQRGPQRRLSVR